MPAKSFSRIEEAILSKVGSMRQIAGIRRAVLDDGKERGLRVAEIRNGGGLAFTVMLDRGMDIADACFGGVSLAFLSPAAHGHPAYFSETGVDWLRNWGAGLLTGAGLSNVGSPCEFDGERQGLHGRLSNTPAENVQCREEWIQPATYRMTVSGTMREARMFGENLALTRSVSTDFGVNTIVVSDVVRNMGFRPARAMLLYHMNIGWPMLDSDAVLEAAPHKVSPRNDVAAAGIAKWMNAEEPQRGIEEQCFYHDLPADANGMASIALRNPKLGLVFKVSFRKAELPFLTQWKYMSAGEYVMGLEPSNCHVEGAAAERDKFKTLRILEPGESFETRVEISVDKV